MKLEIVKTVSFKFHYLIAVKRPYKMAQNEWENAVFEKLRLMVG